MKAIKTALIYLTKTLLITLFLFPLESKAKYFHPLNAGKSIEHAYFIAREGTILESQNVVGNVQVGVEITINHARETLQYEVNCNIQEIPKVRCPFEGGLQVNKNEILNTGQSFLSGIPSFDMTISHSGTGLLFFQSPEVGATTPILKKHLTKHKVFSWFSSIFSGSDRSFYVKKKHYSQVDLILRIAEIIQIPAISSINENLVWITPNSLLPENQELMSLYSATDTSGHIIFQALLDHNGFITAFTLLINGSFVSFWRAG